jgi:hypothetical protein
LFAPPERIASELFAEVPASLRKRGTPPERLAAGKSATGVPVAGLTLFSHS